MLVALASALALLSPALTGGRLGGLASVRLQRPWLALIALVLQVVLVEAPLGLPRPVLVLGHLASYALAGTFLWSNRHVPGLLVVGVGAGLNVLAITVNGGTMPADPNALATAGLAGAHDPFDNSAALSDPHLSWLGDVFAVPSGWPLANVFSVGDVVIVLGVALGAHTVCGSPWLRRLTARARVRRDA